VLLNKNSPDNPSGPIDIVLRKEVRPSKTSSTEKKQLWGKSYSKILMLERSQLLRLGVYTESKKEKNKLAECCSSCPAVLLWNTVLRIGLGERCFLRKSKKVLGSLFNNFSVLLETKLLKFRSF